MITDKKTIIFAFTTIVAGITVVLVFIALSTGPLFARAGDLHMASLKSTCGAMSATRCAGYPQDASDRTVSAERHLAQGS